MAVALRDRTRVLLTFRHLIASLRCCGQGGKPLEAVKKKPLCFVPSALQFCCVLAAGTNHTAIAFMNGTCMTATFQFSRHMLRIAAVAWLKGSRGHSRLQTTASPHSRKGDCSRCYVVREFD